MLREYFLYIDLESSSNAHQVLMQQSSNFNIRKLTRGADSCSSIRDPFQKVWDEAQASAFLTSAPLTCCAHTALKKLQHHAKAEALLSGQAIKKLELFKHFFFPWHWVTGQAGRESLSLSDPRRLKYKFLFLKIPVLLYAYKK